MKSIIPYTIAILAATTLVACDNWRNDRRADVRDTTVDARNVNARANVSAAGVTQMRQALARVNDLPRVASDVRNNTFTAESVNNRLDQLKDMPMGDAPRDFRSAYDDVVDAYQDINKVADRLPSDRANIAADSDVYRDAERAFNKLNERRAKLAEVSRKYSL